MERIKRWIRKYGGEKMQNAVIWVLRITGIRDKVILFSTKKAAFRKVNVHYWQDAVNLGDAISPIVVQNVAKWKKIDVDKKCEKTKHLYAIGSVITAGCQDCTIWGSGLLNTTHLSRLKHRKLDVRAVRGPLSRVVLMEHGISVPEVYGDPAVLMPLIYNPDVEKKYKVSVIPHMEEQGDYQDCGYHQIDIRTDNYEHVINEIKASELVLSSSLHGIVLAEAYGVPAILLKTRFSLFKYMDYYFGTNRYEWPVANSVQEALEMTPPKIPDFSAMQEALLNAFPGDLWE